MEAHGAELALEKINSMKRFALMPRVALVCAAASFTTTFLAAQPVYETEHEFITTGEDSPSSEISVFHFTFFVSLQFNGTP